MSLRGYPLGKAPAEPHECAERPHRARLQAFLLVLAGLGILGAGSCSSSHAPTVCQADKDCAGTDACLNGMCLPRSAPRQVAVTIVPPAQSISGPTELGQVMLPGQETLVLTADDKQTVKASVTSEATLFAPEAHVAVGVPSRIPGLPDLQIQTEMVNNSFTFTVAAGRIGMDTIASFRFTPGAASQYQPPVTLPAPLTASIDLTFPAKTALVAVNGRFLDESGAPLGGDAYVARLSSPNGLASNALPADATGSFRLLVQKDAVTGQADDLVTVTIGSLDNPANVPQFVSSPVSLAMLAQATQTVPRDFVMPAFLPALAGTVHVTADGKDQAGVTVVVRTTLEAQNGKAVYQRSADTNAYGLAELPLIPGPQGAPLYYQVGVEGRSADYRYASRCVSDVPVALDSSGVAVGRLPVIELGKKLQLSGSVRDKTDAPVMGARVTATQIAAVTTCADLDIQGSNAVSLPTDGAGNYQVLVDPGTYRLEVTPPADSQWPRKIEDSVTVSHDTVHPIVLPGGELAKGIVQASNSDLLPKSIVTIYAIFCQSQPCPAGTPPPSFLAQAVTDDAGEFQAVIPAP